jgi:hypothetical protein
MQIIADDVFAEWKGRRFILADPALHDGQGHLIVLVDFEFWVDNYSDLELWCCNNNGQIQGMTVVLSTDQDLSSFLLRWS